MTNLADHPELQVPGAMWALYSGPQRDCFAGCGRSAAWARAYGGHTTIRAYSCTTCLPDDTRPLASLSVPELNAELHWRGTGAWTFPQLMAEVLRAHRAAMGNALATLGEVEGFDYPTWL